MATGQSLTIYGICGNLGWVRRWLPVGLVLLDVVLSEAISGESNKVSRSILWDTNLP